MELSPGNGWLAWIMTAVIVRCPSGIGARGSGRGGGHRWVGDIVTGQLAAVLGGVLIGIVMPWLPIVQLGPFVVALIEACALLVVVRSVNGRAAACPGNNGCGEGQGLIPQVFAASQAHEFNTRSISRWLST